jgi:hypothetical protein
MERKVCAKIYFAAPIDMRFRGAYIPPMFTREPIVKLTAIAVIAALLALGAYTGYRVVHSVSAAVASYTARVHV